MHLIITESIIY